MSEVEVLYPFSVSAFLYLNYHGQFLEEDIRPVCQSQLIPHLFGKHSENVTKVPLPFPSSIPKSFLFDELAFLLEQTQRPG